MATKTATALEGKLAALAAGHEGLQELFQFLVDSLAESGQDSPLAKVDQDQIAQAITTIIGGHQEIDGEVLWSMLAKLFPNGPDNVSPYHLFEIVSSQLVLTV